MSRAILWMALNLICFAFAVRSSEVTARWPGKESNWNGFRRYDFSWNDRGAIVVVPEKVAPGKPWVWRARFFGHRPEVDLALLNAGYHLAYVDVSGLFGCPRAVEIWNGFYTYCVKEFGFREKVVLEGMSRGGLIVFNWASENVGKVACIYADAAVADFKSWPGGRGEGKGSAKDWESCLQVYGLSVEEGLSYQLNPVDRIPLLVKAGIPLIQVTGDADDIVPWRENAGRIHQEYQGSGTESILILKPGVGHQHGLDVVDPVVQFLMRFSLSQEH